MEGNKKNQKPKLQNLSSEQQEYLQRVHLAAEIVSRVLSKNPEFDSADLFQIILKRYDSSETKLATGLRRRVFSCV